jgi:hypothetical protein
MTSLRWATAISAFFAFMPLFLWLAATGVYRRWCSDWCLTCTHQCTVAGLDLSWLLAYGIVLSPCLLFITTPLFLVLLSALVFSRRRALPRPD